MKERKADVHPLRPTVCDDRTELAEAKRKLGRQLQCWSQQITSLDHFQNHQQQ